LNTCSTVPGAGSWRATKDGVSNRTAAMAIGVERVLETRQHTYGQEETGLAGDPARPVRRQAAARDNDVAGDGLSADPQGVQHGGEAEARAEMTSPSRRLQPRRLRASNAGEQKHADNLHVRKARASVLHGKAPPNLRATRRDRAHCLGIRAAAGMAMAYRLIPSCLSRMLDELDIDEGRRPTLRPAFGNGMSRFRLYPHSMSGCTIGRVIAP
jgi:hypothetical protein